MNQLHDECKSRIRYQKVCPQHGEVSSADIVKGYEFAKDRYVIIHDDEIDELRTESDRAINIDSFVSPVQVDTLHLTGKSYFLAPDGPVGPKPCNLPQTAMKEDALNGIAQVVMYGREQLVMLRPIGKLICMDILAFRDQVKQPEEFEQEVSDPDFTAAELDLTKQLNEASTADEFNFARFENVYHDRSKQLIEAKIEGRVIIAPPEEQTEQAINRMDALKASLAQARTLPTATQKPAKKIAKSSPKRKKTKKKTG